MGAFSTAYDNPCSQSWARKQQVSVSMSHFVDHYEISFSTTDVSSLNEIISQVFHKEGFGISDPKYWEVQKLDSWHCQVSIQPWWLHYERVAKVL